MQNIFDVLELTQESYRLYLEAHTFQLQEQFHLHQPRKQLYFWDNR